MTVGDLRSNKHAVLCWDQRLCSSQRVALHQGCPPCIHTLPHRPSLTIDSSRYSIITLSFLCPSLWSPAQKLWTTDPRKTKEAFYQLVILCLSSVFWSQGRVWKAGCCQTDWDGCFSACLVSPSPFLFLCPLMNDLLLCSQQAVFSLFHYTRWAEQHLFTIINRIVHNSRLSEGCCT